MSSDTTDEEEEKKKNGSKKSRHPIAVAPEFEIDGQAPLSPARSIEVRTKFAHENWKLVSNETTGSS